MMTTIDEDEQPVLKALPDPALYYVIVAQSMDWHLIIRRWVERQGKLNLNAGADADAYLLLGGEHPTYYLRKARFALPHLAALLNADPEAVRKAKEIVLKPLKGQEAWQTPTVSYWGEA